MSASRKIIRRILSILPFAKALIDTRGTQNPITVRMLFMQKALGFNRSAYWPVHFSSTVSNWRNIYAGIDVSPGYSPGCYIQGIGKIYIGDYTQIGPNVGIISSNHKVYNTCEHEYGEEVRIGSYGWIGMNTVILPGVVLGDFTVVGAGAVVTKSFVHGYCVVGGNPARLIRELDPSKCIKFRRLKEYNGYIQHDKFERFRERALNV